MVRKNKTECKMTFRNEEPHVNKSFPRVRGDVPTESPKPDMLTEFSPRARGCSSPKAAELLRAYVFPACAGMFRQEATKPHDIPRFPRVRGDVPLELFSEPLPISFSPRARGCSSPRVAGKTKVGVFPACAGMFLPAAKKPPFFPRFPRVRGDVPRQRRRRVGGRWFSPRARGCSVNQFGAEFTKLVFPACAGMFRPF